MTVPDSSPQPSSSPAPDPASASGPLGLVRALAGTMTAAPGGISAPGEAPSSGAAAAPGADPLGTRDDAVAWLHAARLLSEDGSLTGSEHNALLRLRDALAHVLAARAAGRANPDAAARLTRALADGRLIVTVSPAGAVRLASSARASYSGVVAAIAIAIAESSLRVDE